VVGTSLPGFMTGGGAIIDGDLRVTHGFHVNCTVGDGPQRLEINWDGNRFHLDHLNSAFCSNDPSINSGPPSAGFNTFVGSGDIATYAIFDADGNLVLSASGYLR